MIRPAIAAGLALALAACAGGSEPQAAAPAQPEAKSFAVTPDAMGDVDAALARASANGKRVLLVMGANWCHDSRALAGWLETPRFAALTAERYEVVFVNVGMPQTGDGHNLDVAQRFGLANVPGTPALLVLTAKGQLVNADTAQSWRDAASRSEDAIFAELTALAEAAVVPDKDAGIAVWIGGDEAACRYALTPDGPWVADLAELGGLAGSPAIHVRARPSTDWKCVSRGIFELQKYGATLGFISDPSD